MSGKLPTDNAPHLVMVIKVLPLFVSAPLRLSGAVAVGPVRLKSKSRLTLALSNEALTPGTLAVGAGRLIWRLAPEATTSDSLPARVGLRTRVPNWTTNGPVARLVPVSGSVPYAPILDED